MCCCNEKRNIKIENEKTDGCYVDPFSFYEQPPYMENKTLAEKLWNIDDDKGAMLRDKKKIDKINPSHYHGSKTADYIAEFKLDFDLGNAVKYISRAGNKPNESALDDLKKAKWYIEHAIQNRELK